MNRIQKFKDSGVASRGEFAASEYPGSVARLAVVVGHTRAQPGAWGVAPVEAHEYFWNSRLARRIAAEAEERGLTHRIIYRDGIGIAGAYRAAGAWGADLVIELHFNSANGRARGTETLHGEAPVSKPWAALVQSHMTRALNRRGTANRGLKLRAPGTRGGASLNALPQVPCCLIEPFFGDNPADARLGQARKQELARCLVEAAIEFASEPD